MDNKTYSSKKILDNTDIEPELYNHSKKMKEKVMETGLEI